MGCETAKLVYFAGEPLWMTGDGAFLPVRRRDDGRIAGEALYIKMGGGQGAVRQIQSL